MNKNLLKSKCRKILAILLCLVMMFSTVSPLNVFAEESRTFVTLENVALKKTVYTNPNNNNASRVADGDNTYQYVTQKNRTYLDLRFNGTVVQDEDLYYHGDGTEYFIIDLGASYLMDSFRIYDFKRELAGHERDYMYDLSVCNDADFTIANQSEANWTFVGRPEKGLDTCVTDFDLSEKLLVRYIKVHNLRVYGATSFIMNEIEAYGIAIDDVAVVKDYAVNELATYKEDAVLDADTTVVRAGIEADCTARIDAASTVDEVLAVLNDGFASLDKVCLENVALLKNVYASVCNSNEKLLVNGDTSYQWSSSNKIAFLDVAYDGSASAQDEKGYYYKDGTYVIVDLGDTYLLDALRIYDLQNLVSGPRDYLYEVSVCNDADFTVENQLNANWTFVGSPEPGSDTCITDIHLADKMVVRYIKLDNLKTLGATSFAVSELEARGMAIDDVATIQEYAVNELSLYKHTLVLNETEAANVSSIIENHISQIHVEETTDDVLAALNEGLDQVDAEVAFAEYRMEKKDEILSYQNEDGLFSDIDRETQLNALEIALSGITNAKEVAEVDTIVADYVALVDTFEVLGAYEIIPSPHSIIYENAYHAYYHEVNVISAEGSLDEETVAYIYEIFGGENVTFSSEAVEAKLNVYLTSDDKDDSVETWMRNTYGDKIDDAILAENEAHVIIADGNGISIIGNDAEGLFRGLTTIKFIKNQMASNPKGFRGFVICDYADMAFRGLIEGYYGLPWSWAEKAELLKFGSDYKMNKLVYAPKNDPYHTTSWKELYPDESVNAENNIQNVEIAARTARKYKADLVWTAHCFGYTDSANAGENGIRYTAGDEKIEGSDINLLKAKFQQLYDAGVRTFGLLLDDCDYGPRTLDEPWEDIYNPNEALTEEVLAETTAIVNIMAEWCEEKGDCYDLIFCPASYNLGWMKNSYPRFYTQAYEYQEVSYYDIHFNDNVQIITTGASTFSDTNQSIADRFKTEGVSTATGYAAGEVRRSPLMWTNYPTVDADNVLDFGPIENFRTDLNPDDMYGLMSNPFQWAQFNKTVIPMVCQYTWNLKDYNADEIYNNSMKYVMDTEELADAMLIFTNHNSKRGSEGEGSAELLAAIAAFKANITKENAEAVLVEINKIIDACDTLLNKDNYTTIGMYHQLNAYANSLKDLAETIQRYMLMFEDGADVITELYASEELYNRHTAYAIDDVSGVKKYAATGTRTLKPFADWLIANQSTIMLAANPDVETELAVREELNAYLDAQIAAVSSSDYYHDARIEILEVLNKKAEVLEATAYADLPTLEALTLEVENLLKGYEDRTPVKKEANLISTGKKTSGGNVENETKWPTSNIIDGKPNTTCSTIMGDPENPAYVQIDLGESVALQEIWVVCYYNDGRWSKYNVYTSEDGENFVLLEQKADQIGETANGNWFNADGVKARYVRIVGIANSVNQYFHVGEVKVYANDADYSAVEEALLSVPTGLDNYTEESVAALKEAIAAVVYGLNASNQAEVDAMAQAIEDAVAALKENVFEIVTQPSDTCTAKGENASIFVEATGKGLTYEWYYKNPGNVKFYKSGDQFVSEDGTNYTIPMHAWRDGQEVYCVVKDETGAFIQSNTVTLSMDTGSIVIVEQPVNAEAANGEDVVVTVAATGEGLTYEWYYKNPGNVKFYLSGTDFYEDGTYRIPMAAWRDGQEVYCVITDANGDSIQSNTVTLTMAK